MISGGDRDPIVVSDVRCSGQGSDYYFNVLWQC